MVVKVIVAVVGVAVVAVEKVEKYKTNGIRNINERDNQTLKKL